VRISGILQIARAGPQVVALEVEVVKVLRSVLLALLFSLIVGFLIGLVLRSRLERRVEYIGSVTPAPPLHVGDTRAPILDARHHEEQVG
jgi:hypothetical protein